MAKKKRKKRTIQDIIEDIRELHDKEEDLLIDLEEKADDLDNNEGEEARRGTKRDEERRGRTKKDEEGRRRTKKDEEERRRTKMDEEG